MENENLTPNPTPASEQVPEEPEQMSFLDKVIGVFSEPGKVFTEIAAKPIKNMDWLLPTIIMIVIVIASQIVIINNPDVKQNMRELQIKTMQKMVDDGKLTQEQMETALDQQKNFAGLQYIGIFVGTPIVSFIIMFLVALVYWMLAKFGIRGNPTFMVVLVVTCLASLIGCVEVLVNAILSISMGKAQVSASVGFALSGMSEGPVHSLLNKINPFTFWQLAVIGIGLAKVSNKETLKGIYWVFGLWIVYILVVAFLLSQISFFKFLG